MTNEDKANIRRCTDPYPIEPYMYADDDGVYQTGTFLYGSVVVVVTHNIGRWHLAAKGKAPLGVYQVERLRDIFLPHDVRIVNTILPKGERKEDYTRINLWEVPEGKAVDVAEADGEQE